MVRSVAKYMLLSSCLWGLTNCSVTRHLEPGQYLLSQNRVTVKSTANTGKLLQQLNEALTLESKLLTLVQPQPNKRTLGLFRFNLWIYQRFDTSQAKGLKRFLATRLGEPPVLFDSVMLKHSARMMAAYLQARGFLFPQIQADWRPKKLRRSEVVVRFRIHTGPLYRLDSMVFPLPRSPVTKVVHASAAGCQLAPGDPFDSDLLEAEQQRLFRALQNAGYFFFRKEFIGFQVDTAVGMHRVRVFVQVWDPDTLQAGIRYRVRNIHIYPDHEPRALADTVAYDTLMYRGLNFYYRKPVVDPDVLAEAVFLRQGDCYSVNSYDCTMNRLSDLQVFKFASARFLPVDSCGMNCFIYLQPLPKNQISAEWDIGNVENNLASGLRMSYLSRNILRKANRFDISLLAGVQVPVLRPDSLFYNFVGQARYVLPRFAVPFLHPTISCYNNPLTTLFVSASIYDQSDYYSLLNLGGGYSLEWKEVDYPLKRYIFPVLRFSYVYPTYSEAFAVRLEQDPFLKVSFSKQLINSLGGTFVFSNEQPGTQRSFTYFRADLETAGNLPFLASVGLLGQSIPEDGSFSIFGVDYSQYVRVQTDTRRYVQLPAGRSFVFRFAQGIGYAYGNSTVVPFVRRFFLGGTTSMRGWRVRSLGPGRYVDTTNSYTSVGDLMLEGNIEYRFPVAGPLKGAVFTDVGNIWLVRADSTRADAVFRLHDFYTQLAASVGLGARIDFTYFVLRFDVATPAFHPAYAEGARWRLPEFYVMRNGRINRDLVLQLAIGYPF